MKLPHLLTDSERTEMVRKLHALRVRRLVIAAALIVAGTFMPEFHPHWFAVAVTDVTKSVGYIPVLKLVEDLLV